MLWGQSWGLGCWLLAPSLRPFSRLVREFIRQFNLKLNPFIQRDNNTWYFLKGARVRAGEVNRNPDILNYTVKPSERGKSSVQLYREVLDKVQDFPTVSPHLNDELGKTWPGAGEELAVNWGRLSPKLGENGVLLECKAKRLIQKQGQVVAKPLFVHKKSFGRSPPGLG